MQVKCRYCQQVIDKSSAYFHLDTKGKNAYFCNEEHYNNFCKVEEQKVTEKQRIKEEKQRLKEEKAAEVEKRKAEKDAVYYAICDIFGVKDIINTILWKEWQEWTKVADNIKLKQYLDDNKVKLTQIVSRLGGTEFQKIRYFSTILKNSLRDYEPKTQKEIPKENNISFFEPIDIPTKKQERRGFADLEDDEI